MKADKVESTFARLAAINCGPYIEKKNGLSYLSWAWAVDQLLRADPLATWSYGPPTTHGGDTMMVYCTVIAFGQPRTMQLPVMDHRNKAIPNPDAFAINTAMQRCLVKAIALHGIGLHIYAGEDVPRAADSAAPEPDGPTPEQEAALATLREASLGGTAALKDAWQAAGAATRRALADELPSLKKAADLADRGEVAHGA